MWIQTYTGAQFYPLDPKSSAVCIEDIAHALALKCRFTGHCRSFYSIAEHSCRCAMFLAEHLGRRHIRISPALTMCALLHDAAEAYLPDIAGPIKERFMVAEGIGDRGFDVVEDAALTAIFQGLGLDPDWIELAAPLVKFADQTLLATEARDLMGPHPAQWEKLPQPDRDEICTWRWEQAESQFRQIFERVKESIRQDATAGVAPDFQPFKVPA